MVISYVLLVSSVAAATPVQQLQEANQAYQDGRFEQAISQYEAILDEGYSSVALYHNLGNAWYRVGQPGKAALYYHRGLELSPGDGGLQDNLAVIRAGFADPISPLPEFFLKRWWRFTKSIFGINGWAIIGLLLLWGGFAGLWRWRTAPQREQRKKAFIAGVVVLLLAVLPFVLALDGMGTNDRSQKGVIVAGTPNLYEAADTRSAVIRPVPPGAAVLVIDQIGEWVKVRLENGETGWLTRDQFEKV